MALQAELESAHGLAEELTALLRGAGEDPAGLAAAAAPLLKVAVEIQAALATAAAAAPQPTAAAGGGGLSRVVGGGSLPPPMPPLQNVSPSSLELNDEEEEEDGERRCAAADDSASCTPDQHPGSQPIWKRPVKRGLPQSTQIDGNLQGEGDGAAADAHCGRRDARTAADHGAAQLITLRVSAIPVCGGR